MFKLGVLAIGLILCSGCAAGSQRLTGPAAGFTLVAHRGGALVYPESSKEAFGAVSTTAFPIETDLRALQDGTLVPLHDETVDRTMSGVTGGPGSLSREEWAVARILHPQGGSEGTPTTWEAMLDEYGGRCTLVPELKDPNVDLAAFAESILTRGLQDTVIVQTFDYPTARALARSGLRVLYLLREGEEPEATAIRAGGIDLVGPHKSISGEYLGLLKAAGLTVWPYTVNDEPAATRLSRDGADGVFTDNRWELSKQLGLE